MEMNHIDHPNHFNIDFNCPDLNTFLTSITTAQQAVSNRGTLNSFFDRLIDSSHTSKSVLVRMKWLVYLHRLIEMFHPKSVMFKLTIRALDRYSEKIDKIFK
jgi:hypothetical protein